MLTNYCCVIALQILIEHIDFIRSEKARRRFVKALLNLCEKAGFDGVDLNWVRLMTT